jgi:ABC-type Fe3+-siderophore transport system permease subunit
MEKFQIAKYAMMQVVALVYGMLVCGTGVKWARPRAEAGIPMTDSYYVAMFVRDYGLWFFVIIFAWTFLAGYYSSTLSRRYVSPLTLAISGIIISLLFAFSCSTIAVQASASGYSSSLIGTATSN